MGLLALILTLPHTVETFGATTRVILLALGTAFATAVAAGMQQRVAGRIARMEHENRARAVENAMLAERAATLKARTQRMHTTSQALVTANAELTARSTRMQDSLTRLEESNAELTRLNRMLLERAAEAEEANRTKRDFLAVMSHELRTPLNAIAGYAEILQMGLHGPVTESQRGALGRIRSNQEYLLSLITDVLEFAKEESGRVEVRMADVVVADVIRSVHERIEPQVMAKGLRYDYEIPDSTVRVRGDRRRIEQILLNLVGNAIKFTERGGSVHLGCETEGSRVRLGVRDSGRGIAPDQVGRIFDPYVQAHGEVSASEGGAGLGLAISRQLARRMGGDLDVESVLGKGSTFTLELLRGYRAAESSLFPREMAIFGPEETPTVPMRLTDTAAAG